MRDERDASDVDSLALTILICTYNRAELLARTIEYLNRAIRPEGWSVDILVVANACTDGTHAHLDRYQAEAQARSMLPLRWIAEPGPGKSIAINRGISELTADLVAFVDDDHRVDEGYLVSICEAARRYPDATMFCGRILPDWDGSEPQWVHDAGPFRIYPLPVPRFDQGPEPRKFGLNGPVPGGGNLILRSEVFARVGEFATDLGPKGHDLGGGEDIEFVLRAVAAGEALQYVPDIVQHHYADPERLRLSYILRKAYQRSRAGVCAQAPGGSVPLYMWRKLAEYGWRSVFTISWAKRRFNLVRGFAAAGEIRGWRDAHWLGASLRLPLRADRPAAIVMAAAFLTLCAAAGAALLATPGWWNALVPVAAVAGFGTLGLTIKSLVDFSQTGPQVRAEIIRLYRFYSVLAILRLMAWAFSLLFLIGGAGALLYSALSIVFHWSMTPTGTAVAATVFIIVLTGLQFLRLLRFNPGVLVASLNYRISRLYPVWRWSTPLRLHATGLILVAGVFAVLVVASVQLVSVARWHDLGALWAAVISYGGVVFCAFWEPEAVPVPRRREGKPNILMVGSDTLRADRLGIMGYRRALTPHIDALAKRSALFPNCYVPCARTAPALVSLLTGTWPHTHGVRDNYVAKAQTNLKVDALPQMLRTLGYCTAALSDWCGGDLGKFSFGFDYADLPEDQWNLRYLIRQGPKDLRLFLSLFTQNRLGRRLLPEIYYLGGVPLTQSMGKRARRLVRRLAEARQPFFLNVFYSTTHPPFASEWPWYTRFADPDYVGESKYAMARLTDPFEVIRRQGQPQEEFDLDQIMDLYDGCVAEFDNQVGKMLGFLEDLEIADQTILVIYSDHGMEFFEHETWGQGNSAVGDFSPRIPLLIHDPHSPAKGVLEQVVRTIDVPPTLLELVGSGPTRSMEGASLAACVLGRSDCPDLDAFNETGIWIADIPGLPAGHLRYPNLLELMEVPDRDSGNLAIKTVYQDVVLQAKDRMIRRRQWKLVWQPLESGYVLRLFDLKADPGCRQDVAGQYPRVRDRLFESLVEWMRGDPAFRMPDACVPSERSAARLPG